MKKYFLAIVLLFASNAYALNINGDEFTTYHVEFGPGGSCANVLVGPSVRTDLVASLRIHDATPAVCNNPVYVLSPEQFSFENKGSVCQVILKTSKDDAYPFAKLWTTCAMGKG